MGLVHMGADDERVAAFGQRHGQLVPDFIRRGRVNLAGLEALAQVVGDDIFRPLAAARDLFILPFGKQKLLRYRKGIALVGGDQFPAVGLIRILHIGDGHAQGRIDCSALGDVQGH